MPTEVGGGFYWVLRMACREAVTLRQPEIAANTMLISLMNNFPAFRRVFRPDPADKISYEGATGGARQVGLPAEAELELLRVLREVHWQTFGWVPAGESSSAPGWADEAITATRLAMAIAVARGAPWVGPDHLLEALLTDSSNTASSLLRGQGVDLELLTEVARRAWPVDGGEPPYRALAELLNRAGVLTAAGDGDKQRSTALTRRLATGAMRLVAQASPALALLEQEATAETVRLGHDRTTPAHLVLAVLVLEDEMAAAGFRPSNEWLKACDFVLRDFGLERKSISTDVPAIFEDDALAPPQRRRGWRSNPKNPPWTLSAARVADEARRVAHGQRTPGAGSAHLLYAVLSDPDDAGRRLLNENFVDPVVVRGLLADRLGVTAT